MLKWIEKMNLQSTYKLNNGIAIPAIGLGTYLSKPGVETYDTVLFAIQNGWRHIDTAAFYKNEEDVARAINDSGISREKIFVTTKLWNDDQGYDKALKAFETSMNKFGFEYLDLYLIHWPVKDKRKESWKALERLYDEKVIRSIGVSNYTIRHMQEIYSYANVIPVVNQIEFSPYLYQKALLEFCEANGTLIEAYTPLTRGKKLKEPILRTIAEKYKKTPAQMLIKWALQVHTIVLPKSVNFNRINENADVFDFEISTVDMDTMNHWNENFRTSWDPTNEF